MARFSASGTDYSGNQRSRDIADEGLTRALDRKGRADKQKRIKESGKRSDVQKLLSAAARGAAAYYTGGMSETMGLGGTIDSAMLGTDSEGNPVRNEYGDLVGAGSMLYQGSKAQKAQKLAGADAAFDKQYAKRQANVKMLFDTADTKEARDQAQKAQFSLDAYEKDYLNRRQDLAESGFLGTNIGVEDSEYTKLTSGLSPEEIARIRQGKMDEQSEAVRKGGEEQSRRLKENAGFGGNKTSGYVNINKPSEAMIDKQNFMQGKTGATLLNENQKQIFMRKKEEEDKKKMEKETRERMEGEMQQRALYGGRPE